MMRALRSLRQLAAASVGHRVPLCGLSVQVPGSLPIRLSVVAGNVRVHRLIDAAVRAGSVVIDVGANTGYNTVYAARRVGPTGRVVAVEPTADNLAVLDHNIASNRLGNVTVVRAAAGRAAGTREFYLRGETSAVNSFFPESCYAQVTGVVEVPVVALDDLVAGHVDLVKIDVEGAELDVLGGMPRLLQGPGVQLIVEWHPILQEAAGYDAEELPRLLLREGFTLDAAGHTRMAPLRDAGIPRVAAALRRSGRPVELMAKRPVTGS